MGILMIILNALTLQEIYLSKNFEIYAEGQFVESISAFCYLFAAILTFFRSFHRKGLEQKLTWLFSLTSLLFFVRELDLEDHNIPNVLISMGTGAGRDVLFVTLYLVLIGSVLLLPGCRQALNLATFFKSEVIAVLTVGVWLLGFGSLFERFDQMATEEVLEMNGALLFLLAAILHERVPMTKSPKFDSRAVS